MNSNQPTHDDTSETARILKAATTSPTSSLAGAIAGVMRERRFAEVQAIGAGAVNQAVKAIAIAHVSTR